MHNRRIHLDHSEIVFWDDFTSASLGTKWEGTGVGVYTTGSGYLYSNTLSKYIVPICPRLDLTKIIHVSFQYKYDGAGGSREITWGLKAVSASDGFIVPWVNLCNTSYPSYNLFGAGQSNTSWSPPSAGTWGKVDVIWARDVHRLYYNDVLKVTRTERLYHPTAVLWIDVHGTYYMKNFSMRYLESSFLHHLNYQL